MLISRNRVETVGRWKDLVRDHRGRVLDLGDALVLPGLVNAHCHLDYTDMVGLIPPQKRFTDWIRLITSTKAGWTDSEFARSWLNGADMLLRSGTTTVGDFEAIPALLPDVWSATPLRVLSFLELAGIRSHRDPHDIVREAMQRIQTLPRGRSRAALAPHAPYSTLPQLLQLAAAIARRRHWPISIHVSESVLEFEMITHARGEMFQWLKRSERNMSDCGAGSPVRHLDCYGLLGPNLLAVHVNYLGRNDAALLAKRNVSVAHCPRSHVYFQHDDFPFARLARAKVNVCLGTDSLATVYKRPKQNVELSMFEEMRAFHRLHPGTPPKTIVRMATVNAAHALGLASRAGVLAHGARADLIALPFTGKPADAWDAVVNHRGDVSASMIDGQWALPPRLS